LIAGDARIETSDAQLLRVVQKLHALCDRARDDALEESC
jgi:hypothetical protein